MGHAVKDKNYGKASYYVDEERIANAVSQSLTDVLVAKYTKAIEDDPLPFTETRINILHKIAPHFHDLALLGVHNGIRLLLSGNALLTGTSHFSQLDVHNFSQLHVVRSTINGDTADVTVAGLPQPNPFGLTELQIRMARIPNTRQWRIEEVPRRPRSSQSISEQKPRCRWLRNNERNSPPLVILLVSSRARTGESFPFESRDLQFPRAATIPSAPQTLYCHPERRAQPSPTVIPNDERKLFPLSSRTTSAARRRDPRFARSGAILDARTIFP